HTAQRAARTAEDLQFRARLAEKVADLRFQCRKQRTGDRVAGTGLPVLYGGLSMPVVIQELIVTAEVEQRISTQSTRQGGQGSELDREELIRECIEQVMKQLERQQEK